MKCCWYKNCHHNCKSNQDRWYKMVQNLEGENQDQYLMDLSMCMM